MKSFVIGISGKRGSGKTSVSQILASELNWKLVRFSELVKEKALATGYSNSVEDLQIVGEILAEKPNDFCQELLKFCNWKKDENLIIDGIRHLEVAKILKKLVVPSTFFLVSITLDENYRYERLTKRDNTTKKQISSLDKHSTEQQIDLLVQEADLIIDGNNSTKQIVSITVNWIKNLMPQKIENYKNK